MVPELDDDVEGERSRQEERNSMLLRSFRNKKKDANQIRAEECQVRE